MKIIGNNDGSASNLSAATSADADAQSLAERRRTHGRRLEIAEDCDLVDLLHVYAESSLAQFNSLIATSRAVAQDVAYDLGLMDGHLESYYEFASFTETVARHCGPLLGTTEEEASADTVDVASAPAMGLPRDSSPVADGRRSFTGQLTAAETLAWARAMATVGAETGMTLGKQPGRKKDRAAGRHLRRVRALAQELLAIPEPLPDFPGFTPKLTFFAWLRSNIEMTETGVYSSLLGATNSNSLRHMTSAVTFAHGLPRFLSRCLDGDFTIEHVDCVTRACRDLHFEHFPTIDDFLAKRRADITIETFQRSLALKIASTQPAEDTLESVALRRRVDYCAGEDGTGYLTLTGPAPELQACYRRLDAFARDVYRSNTSAFSGQLKSGDCFDDERSISALMFDILTRTSPQLKLRIISTNNTDGTSTNTDFPLDGLFAGPDGIPMNEDESLLDYIERVFDDMDATGYSTQAAAEDSGSIADHVGQTDPAGPIEPTDGHPDSANSAQITPADRAFESQLLETILSSRTMTNDATPSGNSPTNSSATVSTVGPAGSSATGSTGHSADNGMAGALASLIGSRASGARPAGEGTGEAAVGTPDAFGLPIRQEGACRISFECLLDMPTSEYWLSNQARTFITVPMLTLLDQFREGDKEASSSPPSGAPPSPQPRTESPPPSQPQTEAPSPTPTDSATATPLSSEEVCNLAGMLPDGSPIPAEMARRVAGYSTTWTRLLTDPATGTPVDAKATTYAIPNSIRKTLVAQFVTCTFPGCTRPAETTEIDHIDPFNQSDPNQGGLTRFGNLHCLCKLHHQQKTDRKYDVRMTEPGHLEYVFRRGATVEVLVPDNPLNVEHARLFLERFGSGIPRTSGPLSQEVQSASGDDSSSSPDHGSSPAPGTRRRASACPEPAAADGQAGWREADPHSIVSSQPPAPIDPAEHQKGSKSADDDSVALRDWFWDSGEPPPF